MTDLQFQIVDTSGRDFRCVLNLAQLLKRFSDLVSDDDVTIVDWLEIADVGDEFVSDTVTITAVFDVSR